MNQKKSQDHQDAAPEIRPEDNTVYIEINADDGLIKEIVNETDAATADAQEKAEQTAERIAELEEAIAAVTEKVAAYQSLLDQEKTEVENYTRRIENEKKNAKIDSKIGILKKILPILDDMELALKNRQHGDAELDEWAEGIENDIRDFNQVMSDEGVVRSANIGDPFDPMFHQAIMMEDNPDFESDTIIDILSNGYRLEDRPLKTALVRVAS